MWSSNLTPGHISGENHNLKRYLHPNVHCSTVYNSQDMEATYMSTNRGMDKEDVVHIYNRILLCHKKEWNNAICSNMDGPRDYHTEWSQTEKGKYHMIWLICGILKKRYKWTYLQNRNRVKDVENKLMVTRGKWGKDKLGDWDWHIHTSIYKIDN